MGAIRSSPPEAEHPFEDGQDRHVIQPVPGYSVNAVEFAGRDAGSFLSRSFTPAHLSRPTIVSLHAVLTFVITSTNTE